ncbi:unnamed protein product [Spirodela intermedia]|uniref:Uncharacterized protein n=1 Tax=Spirodela intermedia TaxID=51605 RepID=A0A7I8K9E0_SPIIN|nr:unnamed protein product [Spirodela intermedia]
MEKIRQVDFMMLCGLIGLQLLQLHELQKLRNEAYENSLIYKSRMQHFHDKKVWLYNSHLKLFLGKLKSRWDGPYIINELFDFGVVLIMDPKTGKSFTVNSQRLKQYVGADQMLEPQVTMLEDLLDPSLHPAPSTSTLVTNFEKLSFY